MDDVDPNNVEKPLWLTPVVNQLASNVMTRINDAAAVNALNLCATALLASRQRALSRNTLMSQLDCYLSLLKNVPFSSTYTVPNEDAEALLSHAQSLNKFVIEKDSLGTIFSLDRRQSILMTYYRNNIIHLLALPSLVAQLIVQHQKLSLSDLQQHVRTIYPFLQQELFISIAPEQIDAWVATVLPNSNSNTLSISV